MLGPKGTWTAPRSVLRRSEGRRRAPEVPRVVEGVVAGGRLLGVLAVVRVELRCERRVESVGGKTGGEKSMHLNATFISPIFQCSSRY